MRNEFYLISEWVESILHSSCVSGGISDRFPEEGEKVE
jgi:hypothetical protein